MGNNQVKKEERAGAPVVRLVEVKRVYGTGATAVQALKGVSLEVPSGRLAIIKGKSGSGKTTLLNIIGGLDQPTSGQVFVKGQDISRLSDAELTAWRRQTVGFVFQTFGLVPTLTALENVELPLWIAGVGASERRKRAQESLHLVGLSKRAVHRVLELSGGEQQRVSIARALVTKPEILLADEPTAELDHPTAMKVMTLFRQLVDEFGVTILLVTHDPLVEEFGDMVFALVDGVVESHSGRFIKAKE